MLEEKNHRNRLEPQAKLVLVGGFLGAGKTTLIGQSVRRLMAQGVRCGIVTNDQAKGLVDTSLMRATGADSISEIAGGCFCCRLEQLVDVLKGRLQDDYGDGGQSPLVIFAEPVGSCTDLMSTVILPLRTIYRIHAQISPLSVVVDGRRALASLGGKRTPGDFSKDVSYIYRKQLEEAEIVVINKIDHMEPEDLNELTTKLATEFPGKKVALTNARTGDGVDEWFDSIIGVSASPRQLMEVDYLRYGEGEALLGWVNATLELTHGSGVDGDEWLLDLGQAIATCLNERNFEVAHFKMALTDGSGRLGTVNQTLGGTSPENSRGFAGDFRRGRLTLNLRAEAAPEQLQDIVEQEIKLWAGNSGASYDISEMSAFRPGQPVPTARVTQIEASAR